MIRALNVPDSHRQRIQWIESELVGFELPELVTQLSAIHGNPAPPPSPVTQLANDSRCLTEGLAWMDAEQISQLLRHPVALQSLQQRVLYEGTPYWSNVALPADQTSEYLAATGRAIEVADRKSLTSVTSLQRQPLSWHRPLTWAALASIATAATLLVTVNSWHSLPDPSPLASAPSAPSANTSPLETAASENETAHASNEEATTAASNSTAAKWGFARFADQIATDEQELQPPLNRRAYLMQLADASEGWMKKRPESQADLIERLSQFRLGCSAILVAEHGPLPESDRQWLRVRCRSWASAIDRHLAAAESTEDAATVRSQVDATVAKIAEALRGRAESAPS